MPSNSMGNMHQMSCQTSVGSVDSWKSQHLLWYPRRLEPFDTGLIFELNGMRQNARACLYVYKNLELVLISRIQFSTKISPMSNGSKRSFAMTIKHKGRPHTEREESKLKCTCPGVQLKLLVCGEECGMCSQVCWNQNWLDFKHAQ